MFVESWFRGQRPAVRGGCTDRKQHMPQRIMCLVQSRTHLRDARHSCHMGAHLQLAMQYSFASPLGGTHKVHANDVPFYISSQGVYSPVQVLR